MNEVRFVCSREMMSRAWMAYDARDNIVQVGIMGAGLIPPETPTAAIVAKVVMGVDVWEAVMSEISPKPRDPSGLADDLFYYD